MSATDKLRDELTKRGIEWRWEDERTTYWYLIIDGEECGEWTATEMGGYLHLSFMSWDALTPEQTIAATLGTGTCKAIPTGCATAICSECGAEYMGSIMTNEPPDYVKALVRCPNCGRKVRR